MVRKIAVLIVAITVSVSSIGSASEGFGEPVFEGDYEDAADQFEAAERHPTFVFSPETTAESLSAYLRSLENAPDKIKKLWQLVQSNFFEVSALTRRSDLGQLESAMQDAYKGVSRSGWDPRYYANLLFGSGDSAEGALPDGLQKIAAAKVKRDANTKALRNEAKKTYPDLNKVARLIDSGVEKKALMQAGADINAPDSWGSTPLYLAARGTISLDRIPLLLQLGADLNSTTGPSGETPIHQAANCRNMRGILALAKYGADANAKDVHGNSPMHAVIQSFYEWHRSCDQQHRHELDNVICALAVAGADLEEKLPDGTTPMDFAHAKRVHYLVDALHKARRIRAERNREIVSPSLREQSYLHGAPRDIRCLIADFVAGKETSLAAAVKAAQSGDVGELRRLRELGINLGEKSDEGQTPLEAAIEAGRAEATEWLFKKVHKLDSRTSNFQRLIFSQIQEMPYKERILALQRFAFGEKGVVLDRELLSDFVVTINEKEPIELVNWFQSTPTQGVALPTLKSGSRTFEPILGSDALLERINGLRDQIEIQNASLAEVRKGIANGPLHEYDRKLLDTLACYLSEERGSTDPSQSPLTEQERAGLKFLNEQLLAEEYERHPERLPIRMAASAAATPPVAATLSSAAAAAATAVSLEQGARENETPEERRELLLKAIAKRM